MYPGERVRICQHIAMAIALIVSLAVIFIPLDAAAGHFFGIVDYKPSSFVELADEPFFYSIDKTLRYGRTISEDSPVLFKGSFFGVRGPCGEANRQQKTE